MSCLIEKKSQVIIPSEFSNDVLKLEAYITKNGVRSHCLERIQKLLDNIPDKTDDQIKESFIRILSYRKFRIYSNCKNQTLLEVHVQKGNLHAISFLVRSGHLQKKINRLGQSILHTAIECGNIQVVKKLFPHCKDILKLKNRNNETPLEYSLKRKQNEIFIFLLDTIGVLSGLIDDKDVSKFLESVFKSGARDRITKVLSALDKPSALYNDWGQSPLILAKRLELPWVSKKLNELPIAKRISIDQISTKNLAKCVCLFVPKKRESLVKDTTLHGRGSNFQDLYPLIGELYYSYIKSTTSQDMALHRKIYKAIASSSLHLSPKTRYNDYLRHKLLIIPAGWLGHSICLGFINDRLIIGNRGAKGEKQFSNIQFHRIDPIKLTAKIFQKCSETVLAERKKSEQYIYDTLLKELDATEDDLSKFLHAKIKKCDQKNPNCTRASVQATILGIHICAKYTFKTIDESELEKTISFQKGFSKYSKDEITRLYTERLTLEEFEKMKI